MVTESVDHFCPARCAAKSGLNPVLLQLPERGVQVADGAKTGGATTGSDFGQEAEMQWELKEI